MGANPVRIYRHVKQLLHDLRAIFAKTVLVLSHSNTDPERLFGMVRMIETEHRTNDLKQLLRIYFMQYQDSLCFETVASPQNCSYGDIV